MINPVLNCYWDVCLLKESPENTPYSIILLFIGGFLLSLVMVMEWRFSASTFSADLFNTLFLAVCLIFSYVIYTYIILFIKGCKSRLVQTLSTLFFTSVIIHLLVAPLLFIMPFLLQVNIKNPLLLLLGMVYLFLSIGLSVWQLVINAYIYKKALNITPLQSAGAAIGLVAVNILTISLLQ